MITREQVKDLQPGDVVEMTQEGWPEGTVLRGPLWDEGGDLRLGDRIVRDGGDGHAWESAKRTLTVVSRAPRLYVNHPRTEPVAGDVVAYAGESRGPSTVTYRGSGDWVLTHTGESWWGQLPEPLRLLVDGSTGEVV